MKSLPELVRLMGGINTWLNEASPNGKKRTWRYSNDHDFDEAAPPPHKFADRAKIGLPSLPGATRTGAIPPPIPLRKPSIDTTTALADVKKHSREAELVKRRNAAASEKEQGIAKQTATVKARLAAGGGIHGTGHLNITRSFAAHKANGKPGKRDADSKAGVAMANSAVSKRSSQGESLTDMAAQVRSLVG